MIVNHKLTRSAVVCSLVVLAGCSTVRSVNQIEDRADTMRSDMQVKTQGFRTLANDTSREIGAHVDRPWIVGKPQPLARDVSLPPALRAKVATTMVFTDGPQDLVGLGQRIYQATGIPVRVNPDALLPADYFLPRLSMADQATFVTDFPSNADIVVPAIAPIVIDDRSSGPAMLPVQPEKVKIAPLREGQAPLATILDTVSLRLGVHWRYDADLRAIVFYRVETRSFNVRALALAMETELELGLTGGGGGNANSGGGQFASRNKSGFKLNAEDSPLVAVVNKLEQFLTRAGVVKAPSGAANTIVVTDTREALEKVERFLEAENKALTRRVRLHVQEITIRRDDVGQAGIDWNLLFNSANRGNTFTGNPLAGLLDATRNAANIGATVGTGQWAGSAVNLQALSQLGTIVRQTEYSQLVLNRRATTYATRESFVYIRDMKQTQSTSDSMAPTVTVTQQDETVGTFLTMLPDAQDDGQVLLSISYDNTQLDGPIEKMEYGDPSAPSFVQQPRIRGGGNIQQVELRPGQPTLIAGISVQEDNATRRRLNKDTWMLLGGSDASQQTQLLTLLVVTAIPEEGL